MKSLKRIIYLSLLLVTGLFCLLFSDSFLSTSAQQQNVANTNTNFSPASSPSPSPVTSSTPIPLSTILVEKEKNERRLQEINKIFSEKLPVIRLQTELFALTKDFDAREIDSNNLINNNLSLETLSKNESYWSGLALSIPSIKTRVQTQAAEISAQLNELQNNQVIWELTKKSLENDSTQLKENISKNTANTNIANINNNVATNKKKPFAANQNVNVNLAGNTNSAFADSSANSTSNSTIQLPEKLKEQIIEVIEKLKQTQNLVQFKLGEVIKLQEKLSDTEKRTNEMLGKISVARNLLLTNLLNRDTPPIWSSDSFAPEFRQKAETSFSLRFTALQIYFSENLGLFVIHLIMMLALILIFQQLSRKTKQLVEKEPKLKDGLMIFENSIASALILGLIFGPFLYQQAPDLLELIASPILVIAIFFLFRHLVEKSYLPILIALLALYLVNDLRLLTVPIPILSRVIFLVEMLGGIIFLIWLILTHRSSSVISASATTATIRKLGILLIVPFIVAFVANIIGYVALSGVIGKAIVFSLSFGLILYAFVKIADSLIIFVFRILPFSKLGMVKNHRPMLQMKFFKIIKWLAILIWVLVSLSQIYLLDPFINLLERIMAYEIGSKTISISIEAVFSFIFIIWFSFLISRFIRFVLEQDIYPHLHLASGLPYAASTILHYLVLVTGVLLALASTGVDLTKFTIFLGALGVGVGIGLQNIVENFTSGLILLLERPIKVGDSIQMKDHQGELRQIGLRASIVKTFDGGEIIVPNGQFITEEVTNWTLSDNRRRLEINVGVEYGADPEQVIALLEEVGKTHTEIDLEPAPRAIFLGFGESALNFQLRAWTSNHNNWIFTKSDLSVSIYRALKAAGIQIPFPQRDLHLKTIDKNLMHNMDDSIVRNPTDDNSS